MQFVIVDIALQAFQQPVDGPLQARVGKHNSIWRQRSFPPSIAINSARIIPQNVVNVYPYH
jgi:hypothetical protein